MTTTPNSHDQAIRRARSRRDREPNTHGAYDKVAIWVDRANPILTFVISTLRAIDTVQRWFG
ncbi:hypothetical protein ACFX43_10695 [Nocardioides sp. YIM B13467]|uniref:hypothetical protein n=1 Tax=Nocardioides sp. YIM B13467 TaxID=3366294 RepID=UPI0036718F2E